jgi:4-hydroxybenzoate polyprenyltransferase
MGKLESEIRIYPRQYLRAMLRHMGPEFWIVATFPFYVSWVWASGEVLPNYDWLVSQGITLQSFFSVISEWMAMSWEVIISAVVLGPFLGGATLLLDDYHDREVDVDNPRKVKLPMFKLQFNPKVLMKAAGILFAASLLLALQVSFLFFIIVCMLTILSISYSTPPMKLKSRGGLDLVTNMVGFGSLCSLAGWSLISPISDYPWLWLLPMLFGTGALYIPTTIADFESDRGTQVRSISVTLGEEEAKLMAIWFLIAANVAIVMLGLMDYLYTSAVIIRFWPIALVQVLLFAYFLRDTTTESIVKGLFSTTSLMGIGTFLLILDYTGIWAL